MLSNIQPLLHFLYEYPHAGGAIAFLTSFLESLAVIGSIIPGSVTMTAIGMLIGTGILPGIPTVLWSISGALIGDYLSYWIGIHYQNHLRDIWPLNRYPHWLEAGEQFLRHHGGKSIIIGRFFGPMRSMTPMIAGMLKMNRNKFISAIIPAATLWSIAYLAPGILLGALSVQLPAKLATQFLLIALLISALVWLTAWLIERSFYKLSAFVDAYFYRLWQRLATYPRLCTINRWLTPIERKNSHNQLARLVFFCFMLMLTFITMTSVWRNGLITAPNNALYYLFQSLYTEFGQRFAQTLSLLGNKYILCATTGAVTLWLFWQRHRRTAFHFAALFVLTVVTAYSLKLFVQFPRPGNFPGYAFPSGHTTLFVSFIGFLSVLINRSRLTYQRHTVYYITSLLIGLVILSRLYLGVHWFSDVLGGLILGISCVLFIVLLYRRQETPTIAPIPFIAVTVFAFMFFSTIYVVVHQPYSHAYYSAKVARELITLDQWWTHKNTLLPNYRLNRFGKPTETFNVQWAGKLSVIKADLHKRGWQQEVLSGNLHGLLKRITKKPGEIQLPLLSHKHGKHPPVLLMTKTIRKGGRKKSSFVLRLWPSNVMLVKGSLPVWVGVVSAYTPPHHSLIHKNTDADTQTQIDAQTGIQALRLLQRDLAEHRFKLIRIPKKEQLDSIRVSLQKNILLVF